MTRKVEIPEAGLHYEEQQNWETWIVFAWRFGNNGRVMDTVHNVVIQASGTQDDVEAYALEVIGDIYGEGWTCKATKLMLLLERLRHNINVDILVDNFFSPK